MDAQSLLDGVNTSVEGGGGGASFFDQLGNLALLYGKASIANEFDLSGNKSRADAGAQEQQIAAQTAIAKAQISSNQVVLLGAVILAGIVLWKVL